MSHQTAKPIEQILANSEVLSHVANNQISDSGPHLPFLLPAGFHVHVSYSHWSKTLDFLWDLSSFSDRATIICQVASPSTIGSLKSRAFLTFGSHKIFCMEVRLVAATSPSISPSLATSFSVTVRDISAHGTEEGKGNRMPSAMITGTHPKTIDSTILGLHGARPNGHKQNVDRKIFDR